VLTASVRLSAKDTERAIAGEDVKMPEIIITMNRGTRQGAVAQKWLLRAEKELARNGYYEDDAIMVVQMNYTDMPKSWFELSGLEQERLDDESHLSVAMYRHKWLGDYLDEIENSIIRQEWFDSAINAHKLERLKATFKPAGAKIAAHDPSDSGFDSKGYVLRHGSIILKASEKLTGEVDEGLDWATNQALHDNADWFVWDGDGMGAGLKRQVAINLDGTKVSYYMFRGSLSGKGQDNAGKVYQAEYGDKSSNPKTYEETFKNNRAQYYVRLRDRFFNTYKCVVKGEYIDPDLMISLDSDGIENMDALRSECCRIPAVLNGNGLYQIMNKKEMKSNGIDSPNLSDSLMMSLFSPPIKKPRKELKYKNNPII
jgi:phage terminase large subunit